VVGSMLIFGVIIGLVTSDDGKRLGSAVRVGVIDTGVAYNHPDLINNMWDGSNCKDDTGVFLGGCNHGYDFENNDKTPLPDSSEHGTHVAGIIAAEKNNSKGVIGVAPLSKIMALKSSLTVVEITKAIDFAIQNGAKVINASFGDNNFSQSEYDAINRFKSAGGVYVAAAGNGGVDGIGDNNDSVPFYPASYSLDNIISVAATDQNDALTSFSNYGVTSVDVGAPGTNIYSTVPSETVVLNETFESVVTPNIPGGWVKGGTNNNWGTIDETAWLGSSWGKVLYSDLAWPYASNTDSVINSPTINLNLSGANIDFWAICDTEYLTSGWADYMQLEYSSDGINFTPADDPYYSGEIFRWDEPTFDILNGDPLNNTGSSAFHYENVPIPSQYLTGNFKFRFRWVTNSTDNSYNGCLIDGVKITKFSDGSDEQYGYDDGTSMAAPHVAGAVALVWSANPGLTVAQVKNNILWSGDYSSSLGNKILSSERINTYNAVYRSLNNDRPVYRFWSDQNQGHFYTASEEEKNYVINTYSTNIWKYEGIGYKSFNTQETGTVPLYRFWSDQKQGHFYTASEEEKNYVINNYPTNIWRYEGIAFYVYPVDYDGISSTIYRFWSDQNQHHFYTASEDEKNYIIANYLERVWKYEGMAYKVPLSN